jgi:molecular chaperone GrpE
MMRDPEPVGTEAPVSNAGEVDAAALQAENDSLRDRMLRALADAENTRRRAERTQREARQYAIADFARELLPVLDNLQRTVAAAERREPASVEDAALIEGVRAVERLLRHTFEQSGIRRIEALGAPFDPSLHEAMIEEDDGAQPPGTINRVLEDGYTIHDRLLRPARVAVVRRRPRAPSDAPGRSGQRSSSSDHDE